jgi:hypothetical protein
MTRCFVAKAWLAGSGVAVGLTGMATERPWLACALGPLAARGQAPDAPDGRVTRTASRSYTASRRNPGRSV